MIGPLIQIENTAHLCIALRTLKLIAKYAKEGENLGIASRNGRVGQAANNASCVTGGQLLDEVGMKGIQRSRGSGWVDLERHRLVLVGTFNGISA
jgi:hypothetical protein